jgi:SAM-dependent methyltransferase
VANTRRDISPQRSALANTQQNEPGRCSSTVEQPNCNRLMECSSPPAGSTLGNTRMKEARAAHYNRQYLQPNAFGYREWLYTRYIASLMRACGLKKGSTILDVGCGQGLLTYLLCKQGMRVHGIDISETGIRAARSTYSFPNLSFSVADAQVLPVSQRYDCVFVRGLSLYNSADFASNRNVTRKLLESVQPGGLLVFLYYSKLSATGSGSWRYHSWDELRRHFGEWSDARCYFSLKIDAYVLGRFAFSAPCTALNRLTSRVVGRGGDLICILKKPVPLS